MPRGLRDRAARTGRLLPLILPALALLAVATPRVAVIGPPSRAVDTSGVDVAVDVGAVMRAAVADHDAVAAVDAAAVARLIDSAADNGLRCDVRTVDCAARIGAFGGLDFALLGAVGAGGAVGDVSAARGAPRATLTLVDCTSGRVVRAVTAPLSTTAADQRSGLRALVAAVLGSGEVSGVLEVDGKGAVVVDDVPRGDAPLRLTLPAGAHRLALAGGAARDIDVPAAAALVVDAAAFAADAPDADDGGDADGDDAGGPAGTGPIAGGVAVVAASVAVMAGTGALFVAPSAVDRGSYTARGYNDAVTAGRVLLVVGAAGVVVAGAAGAFWWASSDD